MPRRAAAESGDGFTVDLGQLVRIITGLVWIFWAVRLYASTFSVPVADLLTILYTVGGVAVIGTSLLRLPRRRARLLDIALLVGTLLAFSFWVYAQIYRMPSYGTDEIAFDHGAALLLLGGHNPYTADLGRFMDQFGVPPTFQSYTLDGGAVHTMTYPPLSFLVYVPLLVLGVNTQAAVIVDAAFWIIAIALLWWLLPSHLRGLAPILASFTFLVEYVVGGVVDSLFIPFVLVAVWRWDRFGNANERSVARWIGPVAMGLACAMKQTPWFIVPFLLIGVALEARAAGRSWWRRAGWYLVLLGATFMLPNLPFVLWNPHAWLEGVVGPLRLPLAPFGQGLVGLSLYLGFGGGHLDYYSLAGGAMAVALCLALVAWYPQLKRLILLFPAVVFLFPVRSLANYFLFAVPAIMLSAATVSPISMSVLRHRLCVPWLRIWRAAAITAGSAAIGLVALAATTTQPLVISILGEHATGELQSLDKLTLDVHNRTDREVTPHFFVSSGPYLSSPWIIHTGPTRLRGHADATYELWAPNVTSMPSVDGGFKVVALLNHTAGLSASALYEPAEYHSELTPQAVPQTVTRAQKIIFRVRLLDRLGQPVHRAGVRVAMGQIIYAQEGLFPGETSINDRPEGQSPVVALTDPSGVAEFTVRALQIQPYTIFYQAWLPGDYPKGYSNIVSVRFAAT